MSEIVQIYPSTWGRAWMYLHDVHTVQPFWHGRSHSDLHESVLQIQLWRARLPSSTAIPSMLDYIYQVNGCLRGCSRLQQNSQVQILSHKQYAWDQPLSKWGRGQGKADRSPICLWGVWSEEDIAILSPKVCLMPTCFMGNQMSATKKPNQDEWQPHQQPCQHNIPVDQQLIAMSFLTCPLFYLFILTSTPWLLAHSPLNLLSYLYPLSDFFETSPWSPYGFQS